jgi:hypothetical protein
LNPVRIQPETAISERPTLNRADLKPRILWPLKHFQAMQAEEHLHKKKPIIDMKHVELRELGCTCVASCPAGGC